MTQRFEYNVTVSVPAGTPLPRKARQGPGFATMTFADTEVEELPLMRTRVDEIGGTVILENGSGHVQRGAGVATALQVILPSIRLDTAVVGVRSARTPCPGCGLPVTRIQVGAEPRFESAPGALPPLAQTKEGLLIASAAIVRALRDEKRAQGMSAVAVIAGDGSHVVVATRELAAGSAHAAGCARCGRHEVQLSGAATPAPARFSIQPAAQIPDASGWWFHPQMGQLLAVVSGDVAAILAANGAEFDHLRVRDIDGEEAWLPREFR